MAYLIHTDRKNLLKSIHAEMIRIPRNLEGIYKLDNIRENESIYFLNFENQKIYGPARAGSAPVLEEKNPKTGPFNGFGNVDGHYLYKSLKIDCSSFLKKGISIKEIGIDPDTDRFIVTQNEEVNIMEKLKHINQKDIPLVTSLSFTGNVVKATVI